jgi:hypothetical protein
MPVLVFLGFVCVVIAVRSSRRPLARRRAAGGAIGLFVLAAAVLVVA